MSKEELDNLAARSARKLAFLRDGSGCIRVLEPATTSLK
jgi:hypothetical protein